MGLIEIEHHPTRRQLATFSVIWLLFFGAAALWAARHTASWFAPAACGIVAVFVPVVGSMMPEFLRRVYVGLAYAALPIGLVVSFVILAVIYYGVLTPIGLLMRLLGHDPLSRRFDPDSPSYWSDREQHDQLEQYFRQF